MRLMNNPIDMELVTILISCIISSFLNHLAGKSMDTNKNIHAVTFIINCDNILLSGLT